MMRHTITVATRLRHALPELGARNIEGVFIDNALVGWGPVDPTDACANELRARLDLHDDGTLARWRDDAIADSGIGAERYRFGDGTPW